MKFPVKQLNRQLCSGAVGSASIVFLLGACASRVEPGSPVGTGRAGRESAVVVLQTPMMTAAVTPADATHLRAYATPDSICTLLPRADVDALLPGGTCSSAPSAMPGGVADCSVVVRDGALARIFTLAIAPAGTQGSWHTAVQQATIDNAGDPPVEISIPTGLGSQAVGVYHRSAVGKYSSSSVMWRQSGYQLTISYSVPGNSDQRGAIAKLARDIATSHR